MKWDEAAAEALAVLHEAVSVLRPGIEAAAADLAQTLRAGGRILACGNGGSAADAQHFAAELCGRYRRERRAYAALALTTDTSVLTSVGNDYGFEQVFARQVEGLGRPGDWLVGFSTSGRSPNLLRAFDAARALGMRTLAIVGGAGGPLRDRADRCLCLASSDCTPRIQEGHQFILHALCELVEDALG